MLAALISIRFPDFGHVKAGLTEGLRTLPYTGSESM